MSFSINGRIVVSSNNDGSFANVTVTSASANVVVSAIPVVFLGTVSGYTSGGMVSSYPSDTNFIDKFPFASDANATDVGDLTGAGQFRSLAGQSSPVSGYTSGQDNGAPPGVGSYNYNTIDKFPFASDANATDVGDLTVGRYNGLAGQSSEVSGYTSGGRVYPATAINVIDKFPFASDANATDVGDLTVARYETTGQSSEVSGYTSGGTPVLTGTNVIDKFPFATNANATDVGDLTQTRYGSAGQSSLFSGYTSGGDSPVTRNTIDKFPFATNANATDVGDLTQERYGSAGQSSTVSGYSSGGLYDLDESNINKFPFATNANATDVGDLTVARSGSAGQQH